MFRQLSFRRISHFCAQKQSKKKYRTAFSLFAYLIKLIKNTSRPRRIRKINPDPQPSTRPICQIFRGVRRCSDSILHIIYWPALKDTKSAKTGEKKKYQQTECKQTDIEQNCEKPSGKPPTGSQTNLLSFLCDKNENNKAVKTNCWAEMRQEGVSGRTKDDNPCSCHETDELLIALIVIKELETIFFFFCKAGKNQKCD